MFPRIRTVLNRDYSNPPILIPIKDCSYKGELPKIYLTPGLGFTRWGTRGELFDELLMPQRGKLQNGPLVGRNFH